VGKASAMSGQTIRSRRRRVRIPPLEDGKVTQQVECYTENVVVAGSIPVLTILLVAPNRSLSSVVERSAHNRLVLGSNPRGAIN
jgi:hypothetical protein